MGSRTSNLSCQEETYMTVQMKFMYLTIIAIKIFLLIFFRTHKFLFKELENEKNYLLNALFLFSLFFVVIVDFCGLTNILLRYLTWFLVVNLDNYVYSILNGGNNLIHLILFF